eukprot:CAMPEP_0181524000 /NCGR_PEP_ID=MMETSP1110-20121109/68198_1 /TAXON_ID=174948 /ORGANISM="Symbiodinium sp., Strain CCMP421" /LENGTH=39 /DNA_ID= /DNA_START= /DNA_END= /DNA_ORIENTATION=
MRSRFDGQTSLNALPWERCTFCTSTSGDRRKQTDAATAA